MTDCERMLPLILRAADGLLSDAERARLDTHTESCAACRAAVTEQLEVSRLVAELPFDQAPPGFAARVRARVEPRPGLLDLANWRAWTFRLAPVAAALWALAWLPATGEDSSTNVAVAVDAWASGGSPQSPSALVMDDTVDRHDLLAWALETPAP